MVEYQNPRAGLEPTKVSEFGGLVYKRRYIVPDFVGERLEGPEFRASAESGIEQELSDRTRGLYRVRIDPAGRNVTVAIEIGTGGVLTSLPSGKEEIDMVLDEASEAELDARLDEISDGEGIASGDQPTWELTCR